MIDNAKVYVKGGDGGNGCVSFRREKFVPKGGPNGGDGGHGGSVIFVADRSRSTLLDFKYRQHLRAQRGAHGEGSERTGRGGEDLIVPAPIGTMIRDFDTGDLLADLVADGQRAVVAHGGRGGRGNAHFATPTHRTPRHAEPGRPGEERWVELELRLLADVGLVGLPNAGKSTFLRRVSAAKPKVGDYPFTTTEPMLGAVELADGRSFVLADLPGLIEGAHRGAGLGHAFLRHIARTRVLIHVVDLSADADPVEQYEMVHRELRLYDERLATRPTVIALNKVDLPDARSRAPEAIAAFEARGLRAIPTSGATGEGVEDVLRRAANALAVAQAGEETPEEVKK
jgi:GTPase